MEENTFKKAIFFIIFLGLILRLAFFFLTPPLEIPDGGAHFSYISYIAEESKLPVSIGPGAEYYQAPLYYVFYGLLLKVGTNIAEEFPVNLLRIIDIFFGMLIIYFAYKIGSLLFKNKYIILGIVTFVALLPTLAYFNAHITNVNIEILFSTIAIYLLLLTLKKESYKLYILIGITLGLGLISRASVFLLILASIFLFALKYYNNKRFDYIRFVKTTVIVLLFVLLISGWWLVRNFVLYDDFLGVNALKLASPQDEYDWNFDLYFRFFGKTFATFWASFGIGSQIFISFDNILPLELGLSTTRGIISFIVVYGTLLVITLVSIVGLFRLITAQIKNKNIFNSFQVKSLTFMGIFSLLILAALLRTRLYDFQPQGRFFFLAIVPLAIFFTLGIYKSLSKFFKNKQIFAVFIFFFVILNALAIAKLVSVESHIAYTDKIGKKVELSLTNKIGMEKHKGEFIPAKIIVSPGDYVTIINNNTFEYPFAKNLMAEYRIILFNDDYEYITSKTIKSGDIFKYKFDKTGIYKVRNGNFGEVQAEIIVK